MDTCGVVVFHRNSSGPLANTYENQQCTMELVYRSRRRTLDSQDSCDTLAENRIRLYVIRVPTNMFGGNSVMNTSKIRFAVAEGRVASGSRVPWILKTTPAIVKNPFLFLTFHLGSLVICKSKRLFVSTANDRKHKYNKHQLCSKYYQNCTIFIMEVND